MTYSLINREFYDAIINFERSEKAQDYYYKVMDTVIEREGVRDTIRNRILRVYAMLFCEDVGAVPGKPAGPEEVEKTADRLYLGSAGFDPDHWYRMQHHFPIIDDDNYDRFVNWVKEQDPDICVWCEAESRYRSYTATKMAGCEEAYLPYNWDLLARRYGHNYMVLAGKRDTFPQVVTSKYPLKTVKRINGNGDDIIVVHGAGQVEVEIGDKTLNLVTLHTWPQKYAYLAEDQEASKAEQGGDVFRSVEMKYICEETILQDKDAAKNNWIMLGDFNAISSIDNFHYGIAEDDKQFLVHNYVRNNTPYIDVIEKFYPGDFQPSTQSGRRIDMVYMTEPLFKTVKAARIIRDGYAESYRDTTFRNFCHPSDHYPVVVDMEF